MIDIARKDNKGRNLKTGEYRRPDGRYEYRYKDEITGNRTCCGINHKSLS